MAGWNPWRALRDRPHLELCFEELPAGRRGALRDLGGGRRLVVLAYDLGRRARRCVLGHELIHDERLISTVDAPVGLWIVEERSVNREVARRMVPAKELCRWARARSEAEIPSTVAEVAEHWDVTLEVAMEACRQLIESTDVGARGRHPSSRAIGES